MDWEKRGTAKTLEQVIEANSGLSVDELLNPRPVPPQSIVGMAAAAERIVEAIAEEEYIRIFGDYDADGITSTAILSTLLQHMGHTPDLRLPKRHSEGYGLSMKAVEECDEGLLITIDNGIAAVEPVAAFQRKGVSVVVIDHHMPGETIPNAEVVVDPHINPEHSDRESFRHYCGAGLALKLAELLLGFVPQTLEILTGTRDGLSKALMHSPVVRRICSDPYIAQLLGKSQSELEEDFKAKALMEQLRGNTQALERIAGYVETLHAVLPEAEKKQALANYAVLRNCTALAAIGTVADVVHLVGDNRRIVMEGLAVMSERTGLLPGIAALLEKLELQSPTEEDIAFRIGPVLNAPGRMEDDGAKKALQALLAPDEKEAGVRALELLKINALRKAVVGEQMEKAQNIIKDECKYGAAPLTIYDPDIPHGIVGILAGRMVDQMKIPVLVFADAEGDVVKGSGRSVDDVDLYELLKPLEESFATFGGHAGAVGLSIRKEDFHEVAAKIESLLPDYSPKTTALEYDLEIKAGEVATVQQQLLRFAPFGKGNPMPVFRVKDILITPRYGKIYRALGDDSSHVKLFADGFDVMMFGKMREYLQMGQPRSIEAIGTISKKRFFNTDLLQVSASDIARAKDNRPAASSLTVALEENKKRFA